MNKKYDYKTMSDLYSELLSNSEGIILLVGSEAESELETESELPAGIQYNEEMVAKRCTKWVRKNGIISFLLITSIDRCFKENNGIST